jgi:hypothetical protein
LVLLIGLLAFISFCLKPLLCSHAMLAFNSGYVLVTFFLLGLLFIAYQVSLYILWICLCSFSFFFCSYSLSSTFMLQMANAKNSLLSQIHDKQLSWNAKVLVSRVWHFRGGTDEGTIVHTDIVVLDQEVCSTFKRLRSCC